MDLSLRDLIAQLANSPDWEHHQQLTELLERKAKIDGEITALVAAQFPEPEKREEEEKRSPQHSTVVEGIKR